MKPLQPHRIHIGLRTVKTGLAVAIALLIAGLRDAAMPILAAIGAIGAMSRTLHDSWEVCLTQFAGILIGCTLAYFYVTLLPFCRDPAAIGLGLIGIITLCNFLRLDYAISLSCIIFVSICLSGDDVLWYAVNRFADTSTGLAVAYAVNALIKPYNNRGAILREIDAFLSELTPLLRDRVAAEHYPNLDVLHERLLHLDAELEIYEQQSFPLRKERRGDCIYLRGCQQLAERIMQEFDALCMMDVPGVLSQENFQRLEARGMDLPRPKRAGQDAHSSVMNYHLGNLLDAYAYLEEMRREQEPPKPAEKRGWRALRPKARR